MSACFTDKETAANVSIFSYMVKHDKKDIFSRYHEQLEGSLLPIYKKYIPTYVFPLVSSSTDNLSFISKSLNEASVTHQRLFVLDQADNPSGLLIIRQVVWHGRQHWLIVLLGHRIMS